MLSEEKTLWIHAHDSLQGQRLNVLPEVALKTWNLQTGLTWTNMDLRVRGMLPSRHTSLGSSSFHKLSGLHFATPNHTNTIASKTQLKATPWHPAVSITEDSSDTFRSKVVPNITTQPGQLVVAMPVVGAKAQQGSVASACWRKLSSR